MKKFFENIIFKNDENYIVKGDVVDLRFRYSTTEKTAYDGVATCYYDILEHKTSLKVGSIDLRLTMNEDMYYYGHIGYNILQKYRGHNYAYYACLLVFKEAKEKHHMNELIITCNPDNTPSYKILKKLGGELIEVIQVPKDHELYRLGDKFKCIFRYKIDL